MGVILDIFASRARTNEAKLQVRACRSTLCPSHSSFDKDTPAPFVVGFV